MVLLVIMTGVAGLPLFDRPGMRFVTGGAGESGMAGFLVKADEPRVAGRAAGHRLEFRLPHMAGAARHRHHGCGGVDLVAGDTVQGRPVACPVAEVAKDSGVRSL